MTRYSFALSTNNEISQAGVVQSDSFTDALKLLGEQMTVKAGDTLEIGVYGFPRHATSASRRSARATSSGARPD